MSHRTKYSPTFNIGNTVIDCNKLQIEIDMTFENNGIVTVFEGRFVIEMIFAVYQLYHPFLHYYALMEQGEIDVESVNCCYAVRKVVEDGVQIMIYLYTFDDPFDMESIRLIRSKSFID